MIIGKELERRLKNILQKQKQEGPYVLVRKEDDSLAWVNRFGAVTMIGEVVTDEEVIGMPMTK